MLGGDDGWGGEGPADEGAFKLSIKDENEPTLWKDGGSVIMEKREQAERPEGRKGFDSL